MLGDIYCAPWRQGRVALSVFGPPRGVGKATLVRSGEPSTFARTAATDERDGGGKTEMEAKIPGEREHDFVLVLAGPLELSEDVENALFEAGCDDATISVRLGRIFLSFSRVAPSHREAILSAIRDVMKAKIGARILRVDENDLVSQSEIAHKIGRSRQLVHQFITGARGPGGFPAPVCQLSDRAALWRWSEVANWLWENGMVKEEDLRAAEDSAVINSVLNFAYCKTLKPDLAAELCSNLELPLPTA